MGKNNRQLKISQLNFRTVPDPDVAGKEIECVEYTEHRSKNRPGDRHQLNLENKVVVQYARPELGERYHVHLFRFYLSKLPECAFQEDIFYWKARSTIPEGADQPWYKVVQKFCPLSYKLLKPALLT